MLVIILILIMISQRPHSPFRVQEERVREGMTPELVAEHTSARPSLYGCVTFYFAPPNLVGSL